MKMFRSVLSILTLLVIGSVLSLEMRSNEEAAAVTYTDVTATSGLRFLHRNSATSNKYLIESATGGVAVFDYDNDGWLDVFFVNGAKLKDAQPDAEIPDKS